MTENKLAIKVEDLLKVYKEPSNNQGLIALTSVEFEIMEGEMIAIIGPSGSGKSTLLNLLGGLLNPTAGRIFVNSIPVHELQGEGLENYRRETVGFLWQKVGDNLISGLSIADNIRMVQEISGYTGKEADEWAKYLLEEVQLSNRQHHKPYELSGGEAQRAGIVVALATKPFLLLADEPTGELDTATADQIISMLQSIKEQHGITMIVTTHDHRLETQTDRVLKIQDGRLSGVWEKEGEELAALDQYGTVRLPEHIREKLVHAKNLKFTIKDGKIVVEEEE